jgi:D-amino-acid oxidase
MKTATVIGCGIIGLTSAIKLQGKGFKVKIIAKERFDKTLSSKVGAIWFPFEVYPKEKANYWAKLAYSEYQQDVKEGNGVVFMHFMTAYNKNSNKDWVKQMPEGTTRKATASELPKGMQTAFISTVPLAEPLLYLPYLFQRFLDCNGTFTQQEITTLYELSKLDKLVINSSGLGARKLCNDNDLRPMRGQILRCKKMEGIPSCADSTKKGALSYVINRSTDCVIGGTDYENDWNLNVEQSDTDLITNRLISGGLSNKKPEIIEQIVGLRPKRSAVRFETDNNYPNVFHNYGHGGAGFTVAWGCAIELAELLDKK